MSANFTQSEISSSATAPAPEQISIYGNLSPFSSAPATPANNSPSSPRLPISHLNQFPLQSRQLRPPKSPLYVPAALRPTERPSKPSPLTPPRSVRGSVDNLNDGEPLAPISRRSTVDSNKSRVSKLAEDEWLKDEHLGEVTGSPTREHWKADSASETCDSPACRSSFGLFLRRHHCRHCGHVFCSSHTLHNVPLDQNARFHPDGLLSRACDLCWSAFQLWDQARTDRLIKLEQDLYARLEDANDEGSTCGSSMKVPDGLYRNRPRDGELLDPPIPHQGDLIASSVPRDWNWSTF